MAAATPVMSKESMAEALRQAEMMASVAFLGNSIVEAIRGAAPQQKVEVVFGDVCQITLPKNADLSACISHLEKMRAEEENVVDFRAAIPCLAPDGLVAFWEVFQEKMQFGTFDGDATMFGKSPPVYVKIPTGLNNEHVMVPYCKIMAPKWKGGHIRAYLMRAGDGIYITGQIKRKFEKEVQMIADTVITRLKERSIYAGKSISMDLSFLDKQEDDPWSSFNPDTDAPIFIDVSNYTPEKLILHPETEHAFECDIFGRITQREANEENGRPFKHGILLGGPYGTGKTLAGVVIANMCNQHNITFIQLKNASHLAKALTIVKNFGHPTVLYAEDIDQAFDGEERNEEVNNILNTLDGVDAKDMKVMLVVTTNNPGAINTAFLRAGRVDTYVHMKYPDGPTAVKFLKHYAQNKAGASLLTAEFDYMSAGEQLKDKPPAFVAGIIKKATGAAIFRHGSNIAGTITNEDIARCVKHEEEHIKLAAPKGLQDTYSKLRESLSVIGDAFNDCLPKDGTAKATASCNEA